MASFLLDVNVLLALCDSLHAQHGAAHRWFSSKGRAAWATCPLTENGFVRIASSASYPNKPGNVAYVIETLRRLALVGTHAFWPDEVSVRDMLLSDAVITSTQITDVYLLALSVHMNGKLATFDRNIPAGAIRGGVKTVEHIPM